MMELRKLCTKYNVLLIADEVQTGFGRTGHFMGYEHDMPDQAVKPDLVCIGKSLTGGFAAHSAVIGMAEHVNAIEKGVHGNTYGGSPFHMAIS